jgi:hypothetical protein
MRMPKAPAFQKGALEAQRISRFQRSINDKSPHPARWGRAITFRAFGPQDNNLYMI